VSFGPDIRPADPAGGRNGELTRVPAAIRAGRWRAASKVRRWRSAAPGKDRQKPTTIHYSPALASSFDFRLDLALAHFRGTTSDLVSQLQAELAQLDAQRPAAPAGASR
jgi:hypothetical protein